MTNFVNRFRVMLIVVAMLTMNLGLTAPSVIKAADEYDDMRTKWKEMITGGTSYNTSDPDIAPKITAITSTAQSNWSAMNSNKYWNDLASTTISSQIKDAFNRLYEMALAYSTYGSSLYGSTSLKNDIVTGLNWYYSNRYNQNVTAYDNWADWELHSPRVVLNILALLYDDAPAATRNNLLAAVDHFVPVPTRSGSNRIVSAWIVMGSGVIGKSGTKISAGRDGLAPEFNYVTSSSGYYRDGSYIFHSRHPYNGGYGVTSIDEMSKALYLLSGSSYWSGLNSNYTNVFQWIYDSYEPLIFKGEMPDMVRGRNNTRPQSAYAHDRGHAVMTSMIRLAELGSSETARLKSLIKYLIQSDTVLSYYTSADINYVIKGKAIVADSSVVSRGDLTLTKVFANMARFTSMRPDYMFGVSASSSRVYNYQGFAENKKGWYTGDGMTYLYKTGENQYGDAFWATVDPYRLPGTTVDRFTRANSDGSDYLSSKNWVGGTVVNDKYAAFGMELDAWNSTLTAKKSWFTFDNEIVALGSGITNSDNRTIETTMENRKINSSGNNALKVNGTTKSASLGWSETMTGVNWMHLAGTGGYYFPSPQTVKGLRQARTGNFNDVNSTYGNSTNHTRNYMTLWFDHGTNPTNASYSYVLLPGMSDTQTSAYASNPAVSVLENSTSAQGVYHDDLNVTAVNFWNDANKTVGDITSNKKAAVAMQEVADSSLRISVADPTHANTGTIAIEIAQSAIGVLTADPGITVTQLSPTIKFTVNVNAVRGKTFSAEFALTEPGGPGDALIYENFISGAGNFTEVLGGTWTVADGKYRLTSPASVLPHGNLSVHNTVVTADEYTITADAVNTLSSNGFRDFSLIFDYTDVNNYYYVSYSEEGAPNNQTNGIFKYVNGVLTELTNITATTSAGTTYALKVERDGTAIRAYLNNTLIASASDSTFSGGKVGFGTRNDAADFDNLLVTGSQSSDTVDPNVSITSPANSATVSGTINVAATASDNVGVVGVQFKLNGSNLGSEVTAPPYTIAWNTTTVSNGNYTLTAVARDAANNSKVSTPVSVAVSNGGGGGPLISEDFTSGAGNFTVVSGGTWSVTGGKYRLASAASALPHGNLAVHNTVVSASSYTITADAVNTSSSNGFRDFSLIFDYTDVNNYYYVSYSEEGAPNNQTNGIFKYVNGVLTELANITATTSAGTTYALKVERDGTAIRAYLNNTLVANTTDSTFSGGKVGFGSRNDNTDFDNLIVQ